MLLTIISRARMRLAFSGVSALAEAIGLARDFLESRDRGTGLTITASSITGRGSKSLQLCGVSDEQLTDFLAWFTRE
jgi:hypothetical protein